MEICLLDVAQQELDGAVAYYNVESPGLGDQFLLEVLAAFRTNQTVSTGVAPVHRE